MGDLSSSWSYFFGNVPLSEKTPLIETKEKDSKDERRHKRWWTDITLVYLSLLLAEMSRNIIMPTQALYVNSLGGGNLLLGYSVAAFNVGNLISIFIFDYLAYTYSYKPVLAFAVLICMIGNTMYGLAYLLTGPYLLVIGRLISGIGAGTFGLQKAFIAHITNDSERPRFMFILGSVQYLGLAVIPAFGSLLLNIPSFRVGIVVLDERTIPGNVMGILNIILFFLILFLFQNPPALRKHPEHDYSTSYLSHIYTLNTAQKAIVSVIFFSVYFVIRLTLGILETFGIPIYVQMRHADVGDLEKEQYGGYFFGIFGVFGLVILVLRVVGIKYVKDLKTLLPGLFCTLLGIIVLAEDTLSFAGFTIGCGLIWGVGYPLTQTIIVAMYSQFLGDTNQTKWMAWFSATGAFGRVVGPVLTSYVYEFYGQQDTMVFGTAFAGYALLASVALMYFRKLN